MSRMMVVLIALLLSLPVAAQGRHKSEGRGHERYRVRSGDTLELLAAEYYGNRVHKIYIMVENGLDHDRALKTGERLRIPVSQRITTAAGDTMAGLAQTYLGSAARAGYLAEFNNLSRNTTTLPLGQEIVVPMQVSYRAKGDEMLRDVALSLFADAKQAKLLRTYNQLSGESLKPGQLISVPVPKIQIQASKRRPQDAAATARANKRAAMIRRAMQSLPIARTAWRQGDFAVVKHELTQLEVDYLDMDSATEAGVLLGSVYIAFADEDSALAMFSKVIELNPGFTLDEATHSPKVRKVWARAVTQK